MSAVCGSIKRRKKLSEAEKWGVVAFSNSYRDDYPLPHSGIRPRQNHGKEVEDLAVPQTLYQEALGHIAALAALQEAP